MRRKQRVSKNRFGRWRKPRIGEYVTDGFGQYGIVGKKGVYYSGEKYPVTRYGSLKIITKEEYDYYLANYTRESKNFVDREAPSFHCKKCGKWVNGWIYWKCSVCYPDSCLTSHQDAKKTTDLKEWEPATVKEMEENIKCDKCKRREIRRDSLPCTICRDKYARSYHIPLNEPSPEPNEEDGSSTGIKCPNCGSISVQIEPLGDIEHYANVLYSCDDCWWIGPEEDSRTESG